MSLNLTETRQIRKFGLVALIIFGCLFSFAVWREKAFPAYLFGFLSIFGLGFILLPATLRPVYKAWLKVAYTISRVVTVLILTLVYYFVITPAGLVKRLLGGTPIPVKPDKNALSYWVMRSEPLQPKERFIKRY